MPISFWVKGVPRSLAAQKKEAYTALIQEAARSVFKKPVQSPRIDIEIIFAAKDRNLRADVDNEFAGSDIALRGELPNQRFKVVSQAQRSRFWMH